MFLWVAIGAFVFLVLLKVLSTDDKDGSGTVGGSSGRQVSTSYTYTSGAHRPRK